MSETPRPPYVQFEIRAVEDRTASEDAGHYVAKDVIFAIVTPAGTRDRIEKVAEEWLLGIKEGVAQERIPAEWEHAYRRALKDFTESRETPEEGTPVTQWPTATPAQVKLLLDLNIRTVEALAEMTEEAIGRVGMGGRALKTKAQAWLDSAKGQGKLASELEHLRTENADLKARDEKREEELKLLKAQVEALAEKK